MKTKDLGALIARVCGSILALGGIGLFGHMIFTLFARGDVLLASIILAAIILFAGIIVGSIMEDYGEKKETLRKLHRNKEEYNKSSFSNDFN